jgi:N-acyl-D-amino-acid deacylase
LGHYCREQGLFTLEQAVHKMTGLSARNFRLVDRGEIRPGAWADITVFDPERIIDRATFDSPLERAAGIESVWVNGQLSWTQGGAGPALGAGRLLSLRAS